MPEVAACQHKNVWVDKELGGNLAARPPEAKAHRAHALISIRFARESSRVTTTPTKNITSQASAIGWIPLQGDGTDDKPDHGYGLKER